MHEFVANMSTEVVESPLGYAPNLTSMQQKLESSSSSAVGSAAIESCWQRFQIPVRKPGQKVPFFLVPAQAHQVPSQQSPAFVLVEKPASAMGSWKWWCPVVVWVSFLGKGWPRFALFLGILVWWVQLPRLIPAVLSWSLLLVLVLKSAELRRLFFYGAESESFWWCWCSGLLSCCD